MGHRALQALTGDGLPQFVTGPRTCARWVVLGPQRKRRKAPCDLYPFLATALCFGEDQFQQAN